jgi:CubicO group peptidase (beta-lactamase class C family)
MAAKAAMRAPLRVFVAPLFVFACARAPAGTRAPADPPVATAPARASDLPKLDVAAIDAYFAEEMKKRAVVGAQLMVVQGGEVVLERSYGLSSSSAGKTVDAETAFAIGSISKQFVCVAALMLEDDGKLSLDDEVAKYFPDLTRASEITLADLGGHMSGYPDFYPLDFIDRRMMKPIEPDELLRRYAKVPLEFEPRTRYSYSNTGFIVLGRVIEKVAGQPLREVLLERVFTKLGMAHTSFDPPIGAPGLAAGHISIALGEPQPAPREADGWINAAGGVYSTARDMVKWNLALADGKLLSAASMQRMATAHTLPDGRSTDYGCGIGVRRMAGETVLSHSGAVSGFAAYNAVVPRTRSAVTVLVNTEGGSSGEVHQHILGMLVGPITFVPEVEGPPAKDVALALLQQLQRGELDRSRLGEEFSAFFDDAKVREAAPRLKALGEPKRVEAGEARGRGGMEVTTIRFEFTGRTVKALLYRTPDGIVQEFLLLHD